MLCFQDDKSLRTLTTALGAGTMLFGLWPALAPGSFARAFGLPTGASAGASAAIRSVGTRDFVSGVGLCSAALHGGKYAPWLLARLLVDASDALVMALECARGSNRQMGALGVLALGAAGIDFALWRAAKRIAAREPSAGAAADFERGERC